MQLTKTVNIHPRDFGPELTRTITEQLNKVQGTIGLGDCHIVAVIHVEKISKGRIIDETGFSQHTVHYTAIVLRPVPNEVVDAVVTSVQKVSLRSPTSRWLFFNTDSRFVCVNKIGISCSMGPVVHIFIPEAKIPDNYEFDPSSESFVSSDRTLRIQKSDLVRTRLYGITRTEQNMIVRNTCTFPYLSRIIRTLIMNNRVLLVRLMAIIWVVWLFRSSNKYNKGNDNRPSIFGTIHGVTSQQGARKIVPLLGFPPTSTPMEQNDVKISWEATTKGRGR